MGAKKNDKFYAERSRSSSKNDKRVNAESERIKQYLDFFSGLNFVQAVCFCFQINPSELNNFFWEVTYEDIEMKMQLHLRSKQSEYIQQYEILGLILKNAFGSDESNSSSAIIDKKIKSLPVLNDKNDIQRFFQRQQNG